MKKHDQQNNLNELNEVLFSTLRGVVDGQIEEKKAQTIANLGSTIINNAKTQLLGYKLTGGKTGVDVLAPIEVEQLAEGDTKPLAVPSSKYDQQQAYVKHMRYESIAHGLAKEGKDEFMVNVTDFIKETYGT